MKAVDYCHSIGVSHRDLRQGNILFTEKGDLKIIGFGLSTLMEKKIEEPKNRTCISYFAPEVIHLYTDSKSDVWSLGVLLYVMLSGFYPFSGNTIDQTFESILMERVKFEHKKFDKVSEEAKDLIRKMLNKDSDYRFTIKQCLEHKWFKCTSSKDPEIDTTFMRRFIQANKHSMFKAAAMNLFIKYVSEEEIRKITEQFKAIDTDNSGYIEIDEFTKAIKKMNSKISPNMIEKIFKNIDCYSQNNKINYSEFILMSIDSQKVLNENHIVKLYSEFDTNNDGFISKGKFYFH
jgi:calcium-dependent protein kinase